MISKLPYAKMGYAGGKKLFDNTQGNWQSLEILNGLSGNIFYADLDDRVILKGIVNIPAPNELAVLSLPDNLPNLIIANNSVTGNGSNGATSDKPNTSTSITVENVADDRSVYKWTMTISISGKTITAKYDGGSSSEHCYFDVSQITLLKQ